MNHQIPLDSTRINFRTAWPTNAEEAVVYFCFISRLRDALGLSILSPNFNRLAAQNALAEALSLPSTSVESALANEERICGRSRPLAERVTNTFRSGNLQDLTVPPEFIHSAKARLRQHFSIIDRLEILHTSENGRAF